MCVSASERVLDMCLYVLVLVLVSVCWVCECVCVCVCVLNKCACPQSTESCKEACDASPPIRSKV